MRKNVLIVLTLLILVIAGFVSYFSRSTVPKGEKAMRIRDQEFHVEIADTSASRERGLSGRSTLPENAGMLFVFSAEGGSASGGEKPDRYGFWMKDMQFSIDIIWIRGNRIVGFAENMTPEPTKSIFGLTAYRPPEPVDKVLEINAGLVKQYNFQVGDTIKF